MKNILLLLISLLLTLSCKAQSPIIPLEERNVPENFDGAYFKDTDNYLNRFEGNWKYTNGNTSFTISLLKKIQTFNGSWYYDQLVGEYQYIENGIEIVNYLPRLTDPTVNDGQHTISGNRIVYPAYKPVCTDCSRLERRLVLSFADMDRKYIDCEILVQYINVGGVEKIRVNLYGVAILASPNLDDPSEIRVPLGEYILTKQ